MNTAGWLQSVAAWVLWNSSGAAVLIVLVLGVRLVAGRAMSARLRSRLWLLVMVRLLLPFLPAVSLSNKFISSAATLLPQTHESPPVAKSEPVRTSAAHVNIESDALPQFVMVDDGMAAVPPEAKAITHSQSAPPSFKVSAPAATAATTDWRHVLVVAWLVGAGLLLVRLLVSSIRLSLLTRRLRRVDDAATIELLDSCCKVMGIRRVPGLLAGKDASAPALVGVIRPKILLPASLVAQLTTDEIRLIFLHELAHLRRRDVLLNYLFAILIAMHWFNPLMWIANWRMAADRELACDEAVLTVTSRREARAYGCTILKLVELLNSRRLPAGAVGVVQNKALIQRRIDMIASYPSRTSRSSVLVRIATISLAIAAGVSAIRAQSLPPVPVAPAAGVAPVNPASPPAQAAAPVNPGQPPALGSLPPGAPAAPAAAPSVDSVLPPAVASSPRPDSADAATVPPAAGSPFVGVMPVAPSPNGVPSPGSTPRAPAAVMGGGMMPAPMPVNPIGSPAGNRSRSVEDARAHQANLEVMRALDVIHDARMNESSLRGALAEIADMARVDVVIDERAIADSGVDLNHSAVTLNLRGKPVEQILSLVLRLTDPQLDYSIYNGVVFVSSREALSRRLVTRIYDVPSSISHDVLRQMINAAVGDADCNVFEQKAVITAPESQQREIAKLLSQFEQPQSGARADAAFFLYRLHKANATEVAANFPKELGAATPDERTNSVLIKSSRIQDAQAALARLDRADDDAELQALVTQKKLLHAESDANAFQQQLSALQSLPQPHDEKTSSDIERLNWKLTEAKQEVSRIEESMAAIHLQDAAALTLKR